MKNQLRLSVHELVDFLLRTGDIDNRVYNRSSMNEGVRIHAFYQKHQGANYLKEYYLGHTFYLDDFVIFLEGRADGIILENNFAIIDEIKSTVSPLDEYFETNKEWHLGQAKCYAYMYAKEKGFDEITIRLTYIHQVSNEQMIKNFVFTIEQLTDDVEQYLSDYLNFYQIILKRIEKRNESSQNLAFPFPHFRHGQRDLAKYAYGLALNGGTLFVEAPTGIGKTISTLYPFVRSFGETENEKIFYLTAKNSGKEAAALATSIIKEEGAKLSDVVITAKDKICFCPGKACNPDECQFAKDYYTKIRKIIESSIKRYDSFSQKRIERIALSHQVCPFELQLDLSLFVDIIICDYNYFFDPLVYFRRYFDKDASKMLLLIDEAHNLVDRGRDMYSAHLDNFLFLEAKKSLKGFDHKKIKNAMRRLTRYFNVVKEDFPFGETVLEHLDDKLMRALDAFLLASQDISRNFFEHYTEALKRFSIEVNRFVKISEFIDENFTIYIKKDASGLIKISYYCLTPNDLLRQKFLQVKSRLFFSATLSPMDYYINLLGGLDEDPRLLLPSPFPKENLLLLVAPTISIKYKNRQETYQKVSRYLERFVSFKVGNYLIYAPSYAYLEELLEYLNLSNDYIVFVQNREMDDLEKEAFLENFQPNPTKTTIGLAVVGGAFSEGIDLVSDRLIGVVVIGVGFPQISFERDLVRNYFNQINDEGLAYAYLYPGMNRIMQAVGRLLRSESDQGMALLIDDRYLSSHYQSLFKFNWSHYDVIIEEKEMDELINSFWKKDLK